MQNNSRAISGAQTNCHDRLLEVVTRNLENAFRRPIAQHNQKAFNLFKNQWQGQPLILDSCCGTGQSSEHLAKANPNSFVLGVDKSEVRLSVGQRHASASANQPENALLLRADLIDLYRLLVEDNISLEKHCIFYPNPWPKSTQLQRRWHGSGVFKYMIALGGNLELRSNWLIYLEEFQSALSVLNIRATLEPVKPESANQPLEAEFISNFERKYIQSGQQVWQLKAQITAEQGTSVKDRYC